MSDTIQKINIKSLKLSIFLILFNDIIISSILRNHENEKYKPAKVIYFYFL